MSRPPDVTGDPEAVAFYLAERAARAGPTVNEPPAWHCGVEGCAGEAPAGPLPKDWAVLTRQVGALTIAFVDCDGNPGKAAHDCRRVEAICPVHPLPKLGAASHAFPIRW